MDDMAILEAVGRTEQAVLDLKNMYYNFAALFQSVQDEIVHIAAKYDTDPDQLMQYIMEYHGLDSFRH